MFLNLVCSFRRVALLLSLLLCFCVNLLPVTQAVWLTIPSSGTKCVSEEILPNVVVLADYYVLGAIEGNVTHHEIPTVSAKVTSPYGNTLHHHENATHGQFVFTTTEAGNYLACFWLDSKPQHDQGITISLDWKIGIGAKDWESVAKKEKIEGVELELVRLEGQVQDIHSNLLHLKNREAEMREMSEKTNARVAWFSIMSLGVCIITSTCQILYLKRFFRKKKLI